MKTVSFYTLGCRVNQYEIRAIREIFIKGGYSVLPFGKRADVCVINTCAVTGESEKKSRHVINRASRFSDRVLVTGCFAKLIKDGENYPENGFLRREHQKGEILNLVEGKDTGSFDQTIYEELSVGQPLPSQGPALQSLCENPGRLRRQLRLLHYPQTPGTLPHKKRGKHHRGSKAACLIRVTESY